MKEKTLNTFGFIAFLAFLCVCVFGVINLTDRGAVVVDKGVALGGSVYNRIIEFSEGISVDGTTIIDGSGNIDAPITSTTGTFSSTLSVDGATTLSSTLAVSGASTLATTTISSGKADATALTVSSGGDVSFLGDLAVASNTAVTGTLGITGITTLTGLLNADGGIKVDTTAFTVADTTGDTAIAGTLGVTGNTTLSGTLTSATTTIAGTKVDSNALTVSSGYDVSFLGDLAVASTTTIGSLTSGRIPIAGASGLLGDDSDLTFSGDTLTTTKVIIGSGGTAIDKHVSATSSEDFGSIGANACAENTMTVTGALAGDSVFIDPTNTFASASTTVVWSAWVSSGDTVTIRVCQTAASATADYAAADFRADVFSH